MQPLAELVLEDAPDSVPVARRFITATLSAEADGVVQDAELVVSELVTNALLHGRAPVRVRILRTPVGLRLEVQDGGNHLPLQVAAREMAMTGRGLSLVAAVASTWGVDSGGAPRRVAGKVVWAELTVGVDQSEAAAPDLDVDELLRSWGDEDGNEPRYTVRLGAVSTDLLLAAKAHIDGVVRELTLVKTDHKTTGVELPAAMAALVETVTTDFADARAEIKWQAVAAAERGDRETDLVLQLPLAAADAGERYLAALDEADRYARDARLLTMAAPLSHRRFRRWYVGALIEQLRAVAEGRTVSPPPPFAN